MIRLSSPEWNCPESPVRTARPAGAGKRLRACVSEILLHAVQSLPIHSMDILLRGAYLAISGPILVELGGSPSQF
jgi:hypothetical protein